MMAGNPNWWSMHPPSSIFPSQYVLGSSNSLPQLNSFVPDQPNLEPPQSWSQLLLGGLSGEDQDNYGSLNHFPPKRMENWEDHQQILIAQSYPRVNPAVDSNIIKQEDNNSQSNLCGGDGGHEEFRAPYNNRPSWSAVQINMPVSSPRSCVTSLSSNNMLDFSYNQKNQHADHSSECNSSPPAGGVCKKARVQPSGSQPPLKVRKEKLGDRITALHQIVSPFGKTDTASVLLEAIGYIRFLQSQIEALSSPYLGNASKNMRNNPHSLLNDNGSLKRKGAPNQDSHQDHKTKDLRSKGLCLVPVSCTQNVGGDINIGADYWAPAYGSGF
ncbi:transcription factor bHLH68-like isoform X2 [Argentina anserina]|uniref:transcription factor bHLH68-like isoform X2 n=1 Tax=Argentina anserina TaxID=57926 RepID=UPI00217625C3|nr:transcription factor bHLH68-like isoform X2 [Potentilla anserina]